MGDREYSKKTWIVTAVMAVAAIIMDIVVMIVPKYAMLRETSVLTLVVAVYILIVSIRKIIQKTKEEQENKGK